MGIHCQLFGYWKLWAYNISCLSEGSYSLTMSAVLLLVVMDIQCRLVIAWLLLVLGY